MICAELGDFANLVNWNIFFILSFIYVALFGLKAKMSAFVHFSSASVMSFCKSSISFLFFDWAVLACTVIMLAMLGLYCILILLLWPPWFFSKPESIFYSLVDITLLYSWSSNKFALDIFYTLTSSGNTTTGDVAVSEGAAIFVEYRRYVSCFRFWRSSVVFRHALERFMALASEPLPDLNKLEMVGESAGVRAPPVAFTAGPL